MPWNTICLITNCTEMLWCTVLTKMNKTITIHIEKLIFCYTHICKLYLLLTIFTKRTNIDCCSLPYFQYMCITAQYRIASNIFSLSHHHTFSPDTCRGLISTLHVFKASPLFREIFLAFLLLFYSTVNIHIIFILL